MFEEYIPIPIRDFKGLWVRGKADTCPPDHFIDSLNTISVEGGVKTRNGIEQIYAAGTVKRMHSYTRINEATRFLILNNSGQLFDSTDLGTAILTIAAMTDFSAVNMYNRVYISPHNGIKGLPNEKVRVWDGSTMRLAAGSPLTGIISAVNSASAGNIESGTHLFAVVCETASGFLTKPGPDIFASVVAPGGKKVDLTVPVGPSGTIRRHIIATRAIQTYDGNQFGQEYWFIPDAVINDNVTTTITVNFYDSQLVSDALYLFNILSEIPAGLVLGSYKTRMVVANFDGSQFLMRVSKVAEPEVMDAAASIVIVDPTEAGGITNIVETRDLLGITKALKSYVTQDNGSNPNTWEVIVLDKGVGTGGPLGISSILDSTGSHSDRFFLADRGGLILFDGSFRHPELTWKIEDIWREQVNMNFFHTIQVAFDPIHNIVYVAVPLGASTSPSHILVGDLSDGYDAEKVQWHKWQFPTDPTSILIHMHNNMPFLHIAGTNVHEIEDTTNDNNTAINNFVKLGLVPGKNNGYLNHFNAINYRITGSGTVTPELTNKDNGQLSSPPVFALSSSPGGDITRIINYISEKMSLKLSMTSIDERFDLKEITYFYNPLWSQRPM